MGPSPSFIVLKKTLFSIKSLCHCPRAGICIVIGCFNAKSFRYMSFCCIMNSIHCKVVLLQFLLNNVK